MDWVFFYLAGLLSIPYWLAGLGYLDLSEQLSRTFVASREWFLLLAIFFAIKLGDHRKG